MWLIKNDKGEIYYIRGDKEVTVGRKDTDIILKNDQSISKKHCILQVIRDETQGTSQLVAKDAGSKYKSTVIVNGKEEKTIGDQTELPHSSHVLFGLQNHRFKVVKVEIKICLSQLSKEHTAELESYSKILDATIVNKWSRDCTYLTTSNPTLTPKVNHEVVQALIANLPIVDITYWRSFMKAIEVKSKLPHHESYTLTISDDSLSGNFTLSSQKDRMNLFSGLTFVSFSKRQHKHFAEIIESAGGKIILYEVQKDNSKLDVLAENVIVLQLTTEATQYNDELTSEYMAISKLLSRKKRRVISETEIPLAILYCSVQQHCNPSYDFRKLLQPTQNKTDTLKNSTELAPDTQDVLAVPKKKPPNRKRSHSNEEPVIVPETQTSTQSSQKTDSDKSEPRPGVSHQQSKSKKSKSEPNVIIPESEEIVGSSNRTQSSKSSYFTGNDILEMDDWDDLPSSTQKGSSLGTQRSMEVECLTVKNRKEESLFSDSDSRQLSVWNKEPEPKSLKVETATRQETSKKRKRDDDMISEMDFDWSEKPEKDISKKQKTGGTKVDDGNKKKEVKKEQEVLDFDDWGLDDHNGFQEAQKLGFLLSGEPPKDESNKFEIEIEKRSVPVKNKEKRIVKEPAVAGTSGIQKPKMVAEKPNKRPAIENIPPPTPEKRRRIERNEESSYSSIEQVTRNIENITVDENNFSVVSINYYSQFNEKLPLLRPGIEDPSHRERFRKSFQKVYTRPIERIEI